MVKKVKLRPAFHFTVPSMPRSILKFSRTTQDSIRSRNISIRKHKPDIAILITTLVVYAILTAILAKGYFVWDDIDFRYASTYCWPRCLFSAAPWAGIRYRPSVLLFFKAFSIIALNTPAVWYIFNPTIHLLNGILFIKIFDFSNEQIKTLICILLLPALWGTLLFISDVGDVLGLFFFLIAVFLFLDNKNKKLKFLSLLVALLAYGSKETYFFLPLFLFLISKYKNKCFDKSDKLLLVVHVIVLLVFIFIRALIIGDIVGGYGGSASLVSIVIRGVYNIPLFLQTLISFLLMRKVDLPLYILLSLTFILLFLPVAFGSRKKALLLITMFLLALLPSSFLMTMVSIDTTSPMSFCTIRFIYFPLFFSILLFFLVIRRFSRLSKHLILVVFVVYSFLFDYSMTSNFRNYSLQFFKKRVDYIVKLARKHHDRAAFIKPFSGNLDDMFIMYNWLLEARLRRPSFGKWDINNCDEIFIFSKGIQTIHGPFKLQTFVLSPSTSFGPNVPFSWSPPEKGIIQFFYKEVPQFPVANFYTKPGEFALGSGLYKMSPSEVCWRIVVPEKRILSQRVCIKKAHHSP